MEQLLTGLPGVEFIMDDIIIHDAYITERDERYNNVLKVIEKAGLRSNPDKCLLSQKMLVYMRNLIDEGGLEHDPEKGIATNIKQAIFHYNRSLPCMYVDAQRHVH